MMVNQISVTHNSLLIEIVCDIGETIQRTKQNVHSVVLNQKLELKSKTYLCKWPQLIDAKSCT